MLMRNQKKLFNMRHLYSRGFTYVEIIVGIAIILFVLSGMNALFGIGLVNNQKAINVNIALGIAQEKIEEIVSKEFESIAIGTKQDNINGFTRVVKAIFVNDENFNVNAFEETNSKKITVTVSKIKMADIELYCVAINPNII